MKESGGQRKWSKSQRNHGREVDVLLAFDAKRGGFCEKEGEGNESTREAEES